VLNREEVVNLPPLTTQVIAEIEREHAFLIVELSRLRYMVACILTPENCEYCASQKKRLCQQGISGFYMEFKEYVRQHFALEEEVMRQIDAPTDIQNAFTQHANAHTDMMLQLAQAASSPIIHRQGRELADMIEHWLREHIGTHDALLLDWLGRQEDHHSVEEIDRAIFDAP